MPTKKQPPFILSEAFNDPPPEVLKPYPAEHGKTATVIDYFWMCDEMSRVFGNRGDGWYTETATRVIGEGINAIIAVQVTLHYTHPDLGDEMHPATAENLQRIWAIDNHGHWLNTHAVSIAETIATKKAMSRLGLGKSIYQSTDNTEGYNSQLEAETAYYAAFSETGETTS